MRRAVLALLLTGCSYDWAVSATPPGDAARDVFSPAEASVGDSSSGNDSASAVDATTDAGPTDSFVAPEVDAAACEQLLQAAMNALGPALDCTQTGTECQAKTHDWCNCPIYLGNGTSPQYGTFVTAVSNFETAGCQSSPTINCAPCFDASPGICVLFDAGPGMYRCYY
jgi:hypothetical protein